MARFMKAHILEPGEEKKKYPASSFLYAICGTGGWIHAPMVLQGREVVGLSITKRGLADYLSGDHGLTCKKCLAKYNKLKRK